MKKVQIFLMIVVFFAACGDGSKSDVDAFDGVPDKGESTDDSVDNLQVPDETADETIDETVDLEQVDEVPDETPDETIPDYDSEEAPDEESEETPDDDGEETADDDTEFDPGAMVLVQAGTTSSENGGITVDHDFYIGKYEITIKQYQNCIDARVCEDGYDNRKCDVYDGEWGLGVLPELWRKDNLPAVCVSWYDILKFANWLSEQAGLEKVYDEICYTDANKCTMDINKKGYRLPTEQEWQFATRGGKDGIATTYSGSNTINDVAWYSFNSGNKTHEVGTKNANELGIYDMSGNVWEWNFDEYNSSRRVSRGGCWLNLADGCEVPFRYNFTPSDRSAALGVRLSRTKE